MVIPIRILILEDRPADAELMLHELREAGFAPDWRRVETEADYLAGLESGLDVILADYSLPQFDAPSALALLRTRGLDVPFIVVSGAIGEDVAVQCMKDGAADYLLKDRLGRLGQAVTRAIEERALRREKRSMEETAERRRREAEALAEVGRLISQSLDPADVAGKIAGSMRGLLGTLSAAVFVVEPESGDLVILARSTVVPPIHDPGRIPGDAGMAGYAIHARETASSSDLLEDPRPRFTPEMRARVEQTPDRAVLTVPLVVAGEVIGAIAARDRTGREFDAEEVRLAQAFSDQAAIAIRNARLYGEADRQRRQAEERRQAAESLAAVTAMISRSLEPSQVATRIAESVRALLGAQVAFVFRVDRESQDLVSVAVAGQPAPGLGEPVVVPRGHGATGLAVEGRCPVMSLDGLADPRITFASEMRARIAEGPYRAVLAIPMIVNEQPIGALLVGDHAGRAFDLDEIRLAQTFADQAAVALENARLFEESERRRRAAEALAEVGRLLSEQLDPERVAQLVVDRVCDLLGARSAAISRHEPGSGAMVLLTVSHREGATFYWAPALPRGVGLVAVAAAEQRAVASADVLADPRIVYLPEIRAGLESATGRAVIAAPLRTRDAVFGALSVADRTGRRFDEEEMRLAQAFADHAAIAFENAELYSAAQRELGERRRAEVALRAATAQLQALVEASPLAIIVYDMRLRVTLWNAAAEAMFGWRAEEALGRSLPELPDVERAALAALRARVLAGEAVTGVEMKRLRRDGTSVELSVSAAPLFDETGTVTGAVTLITDITERKRTEEALRQSEKLAAMGSLLAGVAHELNNPLAIVIGRGHLLRERLAASGRDDLVERTDTLIQAAERCARIVRNFLALARQRPPERREVRLNKVVRETLELVAYPLRTDGVDIVLDHARDLPDVMADPDQLQQVVVNLLTNAHHAMRESAGQRRLTLTTRYDPSAQRVSLEVADTGPGIAADVLPRLFEPFFTTKPVGQGTGLGLSLCRGFAEAHGGSLSVESAEGQGARFRLELPVGPAEAVARSASDIASEPSTAPLTILVVDDEEEVASLVAELLEAEGHEARVATAATTALGMLGERSFDVVLSDLRMPGMDGPALYRETKRRHPELARRFVFLTGDALSPEMRQFLAAAQAPSVDKPFTLEDLRRALAGIFAGGR